MRDETKKLIETFREISSLSSEYRVWISNTDIRVSERRMDGKIEFSLSAGTGKWISEEEGLRRLRLRAFW